MANAPTPPSTPPTPLWGLGFRLESIGRYFESLYYDIADIWLLGKWLSWPFYLIYWSFSEAKGLCWDADRSLGWVTTWVMGLVEGSTFGELLDSLSWHYQQIRTDPISWVARWFKAIRWELRQLVDNPTTFVSDRLFGRFPILYTLAYNAFGYISDSLFSAYPYMREFFRYPLSRVREWVCNTWRWLDELDRDRSNTLVTWLSWGTWWFRDFLNNPSGFILQRLKYASWELNELLTNPVQWLRDQVASAIGVYPHELRDLPLTLFRKLITLIVASRGSLLDELESAFCAIVLKFI